MGTSDGMLLERFAAHRDQGAFAEIVRRHGGLVMGACRRVLRNADDAEEAFQATFLILARKAGSVQSLPQWLHAVAVRTALNARASARRRSVHERSAVPPTPEAPREDLRPALDEEVTRLPDKYRSPLLLCYFQGKTTEHAASELGWAKGTVLTRLARARELLRSRLVGRGVVTGAVLASVVVSEKVVAATAEAATAGVAAPGVSVLVSGGLKAMMAAKLKAAAVVMAAGILASGGALLAAGGQDKAVAAADVDTLPPKIPHEKFDRFHKMLLPTKDELVGFWDLPWEVGIHAARERAAAENKPILAYFGANGSSLGAT